MTPPDTAAEAAAEAAVAAAVAAAEAPTGEQFAISAGDHRVVAVEAGGGLRSYQWRGHDVLDGYGEDERCAFGRGQLLLPWPNRLEDGCYEFAGDTHQLPLTEPARANAIHGLCRWDNWRPVQSAPDRLTLGYRLHARDGWPFVLGLTVTYALDADSGLTVGMEATNLGARPSPFGAGAHPYVMLGTPGIDELQLTHPARTVYDTDDRSLPTGRRPVGPDADFRGGRVIGDTRLDTAFTDLDRDASGLARVVLSADGGGRAPTSVEVWMDAAFGHMMLFTGDPLPDPARRRASLAVEPMSCAPNALRTGDGLVVLEPGGRWKGSWGITPR